jgi:hypothetical protein
MKIRVTSTTNLIAFLKKLKVVDRSVLLELKEDKLFSKVHTPDKSIMKYASINNTSIFDSIEDWDNLVSLDRIKMGILDVGRLMDCFKHFRPEEDIFLELNLQDVDGEIVATELKVLSASLSIKIKCADLSLLSYIDDNILGIVHSKEGEEARFKIYNSDFSTICSLCGLETNSQELLTFELNKDNVISAGESFRYKLNIGSSDISVEEPMKAAIYKSQLNYVDSESYTVYVHNNRMVFFSDQSETSTAVGLIER